MSTCRGCGAEILWGLTAKGARIPLDPKPEKRVVLAPVFERDDLGFVKAVIHDERAQVVDTFTPHHATCPEAERFRRGRWNGGP